MMCGATLYYTTHLKACAGAVKGPPGLCVGCGKSAAAGSANLATAAAAAVDAFRSVTYSANS